MSSGKWKNRKKKKASIKKTDLQNFTYTQDDVFFMMKDTSELIRQENATRLSSMGPAASESNTLTDSVEFWNWMNRNYEKSTHFASSENMQRYMEGTPGEKAWAKKVIQGKGYEWDWMSSQRRQIKNLFKTFDAGDVANRPGSDVTVHDIITGTDKEQQLKAYTSKNTPHLNNTPKDMTVVTNAEKVDKVKKLGYDDVLSFGDNESIQAARDARLEDMATGRATPNYTIKNVSATIAKAGMVGFAISAGVESLVSYKKWKDGKLSSWEYLKEIMKSGGNAGITSSFAAGIMVPVTATITTAGVSSLVTFPVTFVVTASVDKVVAPAFARGDYKRIMNDATYYRSLVDFCGSLAFTMDTAAKQYIGFVNQMVIQQRQFTALAGNVISAQALEDFEYFASLSMEDVDSIISGMIALLNDTDSKFDSLKDQNWVHRMLKTVTGKNKATKEDIKQNHEKLGIYISKAVEILYERQCVNEKVIQIHGEEIIALCRYNIALNAKVDALTSRIDNITASLLLVTKPGLEQQVVSMKQIADANAMNVYQEAERLFLVGKLIDAFQLFKEASNNGVARANYFLGEYFINGFGHIVPNKSDALEYLRKGMVLGDSICAYKYGEIKYGNKPEMYSKWCKDHINPILHLVKGNDPVALYEYGWYIMTDNPGSIDAYSDALRCFFKATKKKYWPGAYMFNQLTEDLRRGGTDIPDYSTLFSKVEWYMAHMVIGTSELLYDRKAYKESAKHFLKALWLQEDALEAAGYLAFILNTGVIEDSIKDGYSKASIPMYFDASLKSDNPFVLYQLGELYYYGIGEEMGEEIVGKDLKKSFACLEASYNLSKQGFTAGRLGYMCLVGEGIDVNYSKGIKYLTEGYQLEDLNATSILAQCYEKGIGVEKNVSRSKKLRAEMATMTTPDAAKILQAYVYELIATRNES